MSEIRQKVVFDDQQVIQSLTNQHALVTKITQAITDQQKVFKDVYDVAQDQIDATNEVIQEGTQVIGKHTSETIKAKNEAKGWGLSMKGLADEVNVLGVNLGRTIDQLKAKSQAMRSVVQGANAGSKAMQIFKVALASTGIGVLILAIGSLVAFFKKTEAGAEKLERVFAGVGAVINVLTDRVAKLGGAVIKFFSGDFAGAAKDAKDAVSGINEELRTEIALMVTLKKREQELEDARRANRKANAENIVELKKQQLIADDATKSTKERLEAARKAGEIEKKNLEENLKLAQEDLDIEKAKFEAGAKLDEDADKVIDREVALAELKSESLTRQKKLQSQLQGIVAESAAKEQERLEKIREINKALEDQVRKIEDAAQKAKLETLDPTERVLAEAEIANAIVEEQFKILDQLAKNAGKEISLTKEKTAILEQIEKSKIEAIQKLREGDITHIEKMLDLGEIKSRESMEDTLSDMKDIAPKQVEAILTPLEALNKKLGEAFGLRADDFAEVMAGMASSLNSLFASMTAGTDQQLEENEALINSIQERREILEDDLEKELERQDVGLANNIAGKRKELEAINKEEQLAEKEREKLRKKQLAQKLIADSLTQTSNLVTMGSNVIAAESGKGLLGVGLALAAIAAFVGIFSSFKAGAKKLYKGGSLGQDGVTGFVNKNGRSDMNGGRGHVVEDSNLVLGGKEFVVNEATSMKHSAFLEALNKGEFDNGDGLHFAMGHAKEMQHGSAIANAMSERRSNHTMAAAFDVSIQKHIGKLIAVIEDKPETVAYTPGQVIRKETKGKVAITQTQEDWRWKPEPRG